MNRYPLHIDTSTHGKLTLSAWRAHPLNLSQLQAAKMHINTELTLEFSGVVATDEEGTTVDFTGGIASFGSTSSFPLGAVALVPGGWLPSIVAGGHHLLVLDRHMATEFVSAWKSMQAATPSSLLALLTDVPVLLNVLAYVLEGNQTAPPDAAAIQTDVAEVYGKLNALMPKATLLPAAVADAVTGAIGLWQDMSGPHQCYMAFLTEAWPHLHPVARGTRASVMTAIKGIADKHHVGALSLPFLAAAVAVCTPQGNPAVRLFKASGSAPSQEAAYNALADLLHLQLLVVGNAQFPDKPSALLTRDRALAELWVGLGIRDMVMADGKHTCVVPINEEGLLLCDVPYEVVEMFSSAVPMHTS
jgi:hypothetical protein